MVHWVTQTQRLPLHQLHRLAPDQELDSKAFSLQAELVQVLAPVEQRVPKRVQVSEVRQVRVKQPLAARQRAAQRQPKQIQSRNS